jgi:hypothetical protein
MHLTLLLLMVAARRVRQYVQSVTTCQLPCNALCLLFDNVLSLLCVCVCCCLLSQAMFVAEVVGDNLLCIGLPAAGAAAPKHHKQLFDTILDENYAGAVLYKAALAAVTLNSMRLLLPFLLAGVDWLRGMLLQHLWRLLLLLLWKPQADVQVQ